MRPHPNRVRLILLLIIDPEFDEFFGENAALGEVLVIGNAIPGNLSVTVNASTGDGIYNSVGPIAVSMTNAMRVPETVAVTPLPPWD